MRLRPTAALLPLLLGVLPLPAKPFRGTVQEVWPEQAQAVLLPAGTDTAPATPVRAFLGPGDLRLARPGWALRGDLIPQGTAFRLQTIWPDDPESWAVVERLGDALVRDTRTRGSKAFRNIDESMPPFAGFDQHGRLLLSEALKGRYVVLNFIFTRCPVATMCPLSTRKMMDLRAAAEAAGIQDLELVSASLDPDYDTPGIFQAYARDRGIEGDAIRFLAAPKPYLTALKEQMGVLSEPDPVQIVKHTLSTTLVAPNGRIIYRVPGSQWSPQDFLDRIARDRAKRTAAPVACCRLPVNSSRLQVGNGRP